MDYVDLYCERLGAELLAEPVNAATNAAFLIAGVALWRFARRAGALTVECRFLIAIIMAIGIGSGLFHTYATQWARVFDVMPILLFQLSFTWIYARQGFGWRRTSAALLASGILIAALIGRSFPHLLNGSLTYAPALVLLVVLGVHHWLSRQPRPLLLLAAVSVFSISLVFRTHDAAVCDGFPLGTHFLWHLCNAFVLYLCVCTLIEMRRRF